MIHRPSRKPRAAGHCGMPRPHGPPGGRALTQAPEAPREVRRRLSSPPSGVKGRPDPEDGYGPGGSGARAADEVRRPRAGDKAKRSFAVPAGGLGPPIPGQSRSPITRQARLVQGRRPHSEAKPSVVRAGDKAKRSFAVPPGGLGPPIPSQSRSPVTRQARLVQGRRPRSEAKPSVVRAGERSSPITR